MDSSLTFLRTREIFFANRRRNPSPNRPCLLARRQRRNNAVKQRRKTRTRRCDERCEKRPFVTYLLVVLRVYKDVLFNFYTCEWGERKISYSFQLFLEWKFPLRILSLGHEKGGKLLPSWILYLYLKNAFFFISSSLSRAHLRAFARAYNITFFLRARAHAREKVTRIAIIDRPIIDRPLSMIVGGRVGALFFIVCFLSVLEIQIERFCISPPRMQIEWMKRAGKERTKGVRVRRVLTCAGEFLSFFVFFSLSSCYCISSFFFIEEEVNDDTWRKEHFLGKNSSLSFFETGFEYRGIGAFLGEFVSSSLLFLGDCRKQVTIIKHYFSRRHY